MLSSIYIKTINPAFESFRNSIFYINKGKLKTKDTVFMLFAFIIYSTTGIFMKLASLEEPLSWPFLFYYCCELGVVAIYAVLWQLVLKKIPLTIAFMSKSITIVFSLLIAHIIFSEAITTNNIIGSLVIISGIIILGWKK